MALNSADDLPMKEPEGGGIVLMDRADRYGGAGVYGERALSAVAECLSHGDQALHLTICGDEVI